MIKYDEYKPVYLTVDIPLTEARDNRNREAIWQWCRQYTLISTAEQRLWADKIENDPTIKMFSVEKNYHHIGVCGFTSIDHKRRSGEFSLYIVPEYQGKGFGKLALKTLVKHGFEDWGFKRIWGEVYEGNPAMKSFKEVGFMEEGWLRSTYFRKGKWINSCIISMIDEDFFK
jgi:RimJ/RimL family protein N-acetyltransferase